MYLYQITLLNLLLLSYATNMMYILNNTVLYVLKLTIQFKDKASIFANSCKLKV